MHAAWRAVVLGFVLPHAAYAQARATPPSPEPIKGAASTSWYVRNTTRLESWDFFEPHPGGGDPTSRYVGDRLQIGLLRTAPRIDVQAAAQFVQLGWLPDDAFGPGPLGLGAVYYDHAEERHPGELYVKYLNMRFKDITPGLSVQLGRFGYTSGAEADSGVPKIEAVKRLRVDSRLLGEFEFAFFQRSFDGARLDYARPRAKATAAVFFPTQGGFEEDANHPMTGVRVVTGALTLAPGAPLASTEWQIFASRYDDDRYVTARPDNTGQTASRADVHVTTVGTTLAGAAAAGSGEIDALVWIALQTGGWYGSDHRAWAGSFEAGYQWNGAPARLWVRAGWLGASGDRHPADDRHGTFFQMLPTVRRHALSATYSQMNLHDLFGEVVARPTSRFTVRGEIHWLDLANAADRWYAGSGASQREGRLFGFAGRPSGGATRLGTVFEAALDVTLPAQWTIGGYVGRIAGGGVVTSQFDGDRLTFAFVEVAKLLN